MRPAIAGFLNKKREIIAIACQNKIKDCVNRKKIIEITVRYLFIKMLYLKSTTLKQYNKVHRVVKFRETKRFQPHFRTTSKRIEVSLAFNSKPTLFNSVF